MESYDKLEIVAVAKCDRPFWIYELSLRSLLCYMHPLRITLICPDCDFGKFLRLSIDKRIYIIPESVYMHSYSIDELKRSLKNFKNRAGWYYQQLLKYNYLFFCASTHFLIWDLDTILLSKISLFDENKNYIIGASREFNQYYFDTIQKLTGLKKVLKSSAICQYLIVDKCILGQLLKDIELRFSSPWQQAIIQSLSGSSPCEFSEYETYVTYALTYYPETFSVCTPRLFRYGSEIASTKSQAEVVHKTLQSHFDLIAYESHPSNFLRFLYSKFLYIYFRLLSSWHLFK